VERQDTLLKITEQLDIIKQEMDERGSSMTDGSKYYFNKICVVLISNNLIFDFSTFDQH